MLNHEALTKVKRALRFSTMEGMGYGGMVGLGEYFTAAYAVALRASNGQLALLTSLPNLVGALAQAPSAVLPRLFGSRKRMVIIFAFMQGLMWLPMIAAGWLVKDHQATWLIAVVVLYAAFGALTVPAWGSIMAEVVPRSLRGHYFGARTRWVTLATVVTSLAAGVALWLLREQGLFGFAIIFVAAFAMRMVSVALLSTLFEPPHAPKDDETITPLQFARSLLPTDLGRVMLYIFAINFSVNLAGPFFAPYMLRNLGFSYLTFTAMSLVSAIASLWAVTHWGNAADRLGNRRPMFLAGLMVSTLPLLWVLSGNPVYLGFVNSWGGLAWAGFNLTSVNYIYDATTPKNRTAYLALFNTCIGLASALGALSGGLLISHVPVVSSSPIVTMFLLSGGLRLLSTLLFFPHIREVRRVSPVSASEVFHLLLGGGPSHRPHPHSWAGQVHHSTHHEGQPASYTEKPARPVASGNCDRGRSASEELSSLHS